MRVYGVPRPHSPPPAEQGDDDTAAVLTSVKPLCSSRVKEGCCLTTVRWSPSDPASLLCGASDGGVLLYRLDPHGCLPPADAASQDVMRLLPLRRFMDAKNVGSPACAAVTATEWCPVDPEIFITAG